MPWTRDFGGVKPLKSKDNTYGSEPAERCFGPFFVCESLGFLYKTRRLWYTMEENVAANYDSAKLGKLLGAANYDLAALYQKLTENGGGAGRREEGSR